MSSHDDSGPGASFEESTTDALRTDVKKSAASSGIAAEVANEFKQRKGQRKWLFFIILVLVCVSFVALLGFVTLLGVGTLSLSGPAAVASISALGVQPFVLIGILTTSVYKGVPVAPTSDG